MKYFITILALSLCFITASCNKCVECSFRDSSGQTIRSEETCGDPKDIDRAMEEYMEECEFRKLDDCRCMEI